MGQASHRGILFNRAPEESRKFLGLLPGQGLHMQALRLARSVRGQVGIEVSGGELGPFPRLIQNQADHPQESRKGFVEEGILKAQLLFASKRRGSRRGVLSSPPSAPAPPPHPTLTG